MQYTETVCRGQREPISHAMQARHIVCAHIVHSNCNVQRKLETYVHILSQNVMNRLPAIGYFLSFLLAKAI